MGIWDYIAGSAESVKRNSPDLTSVKSWCYSSYSHTASSVSAVKDNAGRLVGHYWPTEEARSKIGPFATSVAKYSAEEGLRFIPGGVSAYKVIKKSFRDVNKSEDNDRTEGMTKLNERVMALEKELDQLKKSDSIKPMKTSKLLVSNTNSVSMDHIHKKPEDAIREFIMMKEFMGRTFLNDLFVPGTKKN